MPKATGKLARWRSMLSESEFGMVRHASVKQQEAVALSRLRTKRDDKTLLSDKVPVLTTLQEIFECAQRTFITDIEFIVGPKGPFPSFVPHVSMNEGNEDK